MLLMYPTFILPAAVTGVGLTSNRLAYVFRVPKSGTIDTLAVQLTTITTSETLRLSLQTVSSHSPSGTLYGGSAAGTFTPSANSINSVALGTPATATEGDEVAIVLEWDSTQGSVTVPAISSWTSPAFTTYPHPRHYSGSWGSSTQLYNFAIGYDDGSWPDIHAFPMSTLSNQTFNQNVSGNPDEVGIRWSMPFQAEVEGFWIYTSGTPQEELYLYDSDGSTVLASTAHDDDSTLSVRYMHLDSPVTLSKGVTYTLSLKANTTTNSRLYFMQFDNSDLAGAVHGGLIQGVSRQNSGAWSAVVNKRYMMGLMVRSVVPTGISTVQAF